MTVRYVGAGGSNANNGTSWATRKLTLNGVEDTPVAAGDIVYVGPGAYREMLTVDVSGTAGNPIVYIGDVTGEHTDGIGGYVRISGANVFDNAASRARCIYASAARNYRTFRGFWIDSPTTYHIYLSAGADNIIIEDCAFTDSPSAGDTVELIGTITNCIVRRCVFEGTIGTHIVFYNAGTAVNSSGNRVENCVFVGGRSASVHWQGIYDGYVINNLFLSFGRGVYVATSNAGHPCNVYQNSFVSGSESLRGAAVGDIVEDFNNFYGNAGDWFNTTAGGNSPTYPSLMNPLMLLAGFKLPQQDPWTPSQYSGLKTGDQSLTAANTVATDLLGLPRPPSAYGASNVSLGPLQSRVTYRSTAHAQAGTASLGMAVGGVYLLRRVPAYGNPTTIALWVYWDSNYDGGGPFTKPRMVIKQPGQADRITTATGATDSWQQLSDTFTPAVLPPYVDVCIEVSSMYSGDASPFVWADSLTVT